MYALPKWVLANKFPAIYDFESLTVIEQTARIYGAMNELVQEYNAFADAVNEQMDAFTAETEEQYNLFAMGLRQEFQDFIDVVDLKLREQSFMIENTVTNIEKVALDAVNESIEAGKIKIREDYNPESETLNLVFTGGV